MYSEWHDFLSRCGARFDASGGVSHFGDAAAEARAASAGSIVAPLSHLGLIACSGEDAQTFLHGQLSNDLKSLSPARSQYTTYCSPQGRMLANFLAWQEDGTYYLQLARSLQAGVQKRLAMFVLRAKVKLQDASESHIALGIAGPDAAAALGETFPSLPRQAHDVIHDRANGTLIALPGGRYQLIAEPVAAMRLWRRLSARLVPAGAPCWEWLEIQHGIALLTPPTQDQFVPQMANMELIGAVSFTKGCYPGQEVVARAQYRGQVKRRLVLAHLAAGVAQAGDSLFASAVDGQASGMVVNAQAAPAGGCDLLAVVQTGQGEFHLNAPDGPVLELRPLPYATA